VPSGAGNFGSPNNVVINDTAGPEFETIVFPFGGTCDKTVASVDVTSAGLVTYKVQFPNAPSCDFGFYSPAITLTSAAFSGCSLKLLSSNFPQQGQGVADCTVTGSLDGNTLSLTAKNLVYVYDQRSLNASWRLEGCPAVRSLGSLTFYRGADVNRFLLPDTQTARPRRHKKVLYRLGT
jgi:hypothetical protein